MTLPLNRQSLTPLYRQIEAWLRAAISSGGLPPGARLPAARTFASELGVSRTTVDAAYAQLLCEGMLETRGSGGTIVSRRISFRTSTGVDASWGTRSLATGEQAYPESEGFRADVIDFSEGTGDDALFPIDVFLRGLRREYGKGYSGILGGLDPAGDIGLRRAIARLAASSGMMMDPENILITGGSQQAIALVAQTLARPGDTVLVEEPTYASCIALFRSLGLRVLGVPCDRQGPSLEAFRALSQEHGPKFVYLIPNFRNPTGTCISSARRAEIVRAAEDLGVPILEDDFVGELRYEGTQSPCLTTLARPGEAVYTSTFSKLLAPGLGVGFLTSEGPLLDRLRELKRLEGLSASRLFQRGLEEYIGVGRYRIHLRRARRMYRTKRGALCASLERYIPEASFEKPSGGLFLWLRVPDSSSVENLEARLLREGVRVAQGNRFFVDPEPDGARFLRLNFARPPLESIEEGVARLARVLRRS